MSATTVILPEITKRIAYDRQTKDYACFISIDGEAEQYIGSAGTYGQGETLCNTFAFDYYIDNNTPGKAVALADPGGAPLDGFYISPDALADLTNANVLGYAPKIAQVGRDLTIRLGRLDDAAWLSDAAEQIINPRRPILEIIHLHSRRLVIVDTAEELFILTEAEYAH